jgi:hypothetical protein
MSTAIAVVTAGVFVAPSIEAAELPVNYARATAALAMCERIDECKDWADKMAALASYAKQADDDTLHKLATRISARAIRRCGELLQTFQSPGGRPSKTRGDASPSLLTQRQAADQAGMSKDQEKQAVRVANVPADVFEAAVESDDPPTVTHLAELGTKTKPAAEKFPEATHVIGVLHELAAFCAAHDAAIVGRAVLPHETRSLCADAAAVGSWLRLFLDHLPEAPAC